MVGLEVLIDWGPAACNFLSQLSTSPLRHLYFWVDDLNIVCTIALMLLYSYCCCFIRLLHFSAKHICLRLQTYIRVFVWCILILFGLWALLILIDGNLQLKICISFEISVILSKAKQKYPKIEHSFMIKKLLKNRVFLFKR